MIYKLRKLNVVKITDSEIKRDKLIANGFELVETYVPGFIAETIVEPEAVEEAAETAEEITAEPPDKRTKVELQELLAAKGVEFPKSATKDELLALLDSE